MIGRAVRIDIEQYAGEMDRRNRLLEATRAGKVTREMVVRYVASLRYMLALTPIHFRKASRRARELGDETLARHFEHKLKEELGHDKWAENDLKSLDAERAARQGTTAAIHDLARFVEATIETNPALYLGYIAFVEYITVMAGDEWLRLLEERCGIPRASMTAVGNHIELDREHAEEGFALIDDLVVDPRMLPVMRETVATAMKLFDAHCNESVSTTEAPSTEHVSAA